jgi:hypothetical protein
MTPRTPCDSRPSLATGKISQASRSTLRPHTPVGSAMRVQNDCCDLLLPHSEMAVTSTPRRDQSSRPASLIQLSPSAGSVRPNLLRNPFAFRLAVSMTETRCQQSAREPRWPDSLAAPLWGESLTGPSLRIKALD